MATERLRIGWILRPMTSQEEGNSSGRELADALRAAGDRLLAVLATAQPDRWRVVPGSGAWSASKDAEHVADALAYHAWIVRRTIGDGVPSRWPPLERRAMTSDQSPDEVGALIGRRVDEAAALLESLTDEQLALPTRPTRARTPRLRETIAQVLIGHLDVHRREIEGKLRG